jgi:hypothetical protein
VQGLAPSTGVIGRPLDTASLYDRPQMSRYYHGPVSDHFDGERFFDPNGVPPRSRRDLLRWRWQGRANRAKWPAWAPSPYADRPPRRVEGTAWRISYVGHASFLIQTAGRNILLDPVWSKRASPFRFIGPKRVNDPGIAFAALPPIDTVLVSHGHYDHLDVATLSRLAAAHRPRVIAPLGNDVIMRNRDPAIAAEGYDWEAHAALVGAQSVRPQHVAVGLVRDRDAWRPHLFRRRFRLRRRPAFPQRA